MRAQILMGVAIAALPCVAGGQSGPAKNPTGLQPRQPTTVVVPPDRTQTVLPRSDTPLQQPSSSSPFPAHGAAATAGDIKTEEILCKGGPTFLFEDKGSRLGAAGVGLTDLIFNVPHPNAQGQYPAAGADGAWLEEGTCAFADRAFILGTDAHAIRYESAGSAAGNPQGQLERPDQYWRFSVYNTGYGHFVATHHGPWRPLAAKFTPKEWDSPVQGGPGGAPFNMRCAAGFYLAGLRARIGRDLDAISAVCARMLPDGSRAELDAREEWKGGGGGNLQLLVCPPQHPFVESIDLVWEGADTVIMNGVDVNCGQVVPPGKLLLAAERLSGMGPDDPFNYESKYNKWDFGHSRCPEGMTAAGMHGRSGVFVDALGLHCREIVGLQPKPLVADLYVAPPARSTVALSEDSPRIGDRKGLERAPPVGAPPPNPPPGTPPPPHDQDDPVVGITGVKINAGVRAVDFRFDARPNASPYIELSTKSGPASPLRLTTARDPAKGSATVARYAGSSRAQGLVLAQDTTYHYVIVVPGEGKAKEQRASGKFKTRSQQMRSPESTRK